MNTHALARTSTASDLLALTKPRLSGLVITTAAGGMYLAPGALGWREGLVVIAAITAVVGAANALNCYIERDRDRLMSRTRSRPLPAGRMEPQVALWFGITLAATALPALYLASNFLTALLGAIAFFSYVFVYTPMKAKTSAAMLVGALPGALPPLMGYTAVTGYMDVPGAVLFSILFLWQIPHFIAISLFRKDEYSAAGLACLPAERGDGVARAYAVAYLVPLLPISVLPFTLGMAGWIYLLAALALGALFMSTAVIGFLKSLGKPWARQLFGISLLYLTGLFLALMVDGRPVPL